MVSNRQAYLQVYQRMGTAFGDLLHFWSIMGRCSLRLSNGGQKLTTWFQYETEIELSAGEREEKRRGGGFCCGER
ncbi:hypothetical protein CBR_g15959 [Chara braunii]|uniref:Uncharacterized protein n=1 Tax=Chara braunii TaxID=69332 RepID=A0A388JSR2_CHABU|nr:hypothetical protein CBR_g15959 [Chara braunii]|eukprot:GBG60836.1 hypothetical protein CBR_g15959 [Chara braunii]